MVNLLDVLLYEVFLGVVLWDYGRFVFDLVFFFDIRVFGLVLRFKAGWLDDWFWPGVDLKVFEVM